jgi:hypothetical protein
MTPIEHYWPAEMLAEFFPDGYGHLILNWAAQEEPLPSSRYTVDHLPGGCVVNGLPGKQAAWRAAHKDETHRAGVNPPLNPAPAPCP